MTRLVALGEVTTDTVGNAIATGGFQGPWDFGGGAHISVQTDKFLVAVDRDGRTQWSHRFGDVDLQRLP